MMRNIGDDPLEGDTAETACGERRTVRAVTVVNRHTIVTYHCSHQNETDQHDVPLAAWRRWVVDHDAKLMPGC